MNDLKGLSAAVLMTWGSLMAFPSGAGADVNVTLDKSTSIRATSVVTDGSNIARPLVESFRGNGKVQALLRHASSLCGRPVTLNTTSSYVVRTSMMIVSAGVSSPMTINVTYCDVDAPGSNYTFVLQVIQDVDMPTVPCFRLLSQPNHWPGKDFTEYRVNADGNIKETTGRGLDKITAQARSLIESRGGAAAANFVRNTMSATSGDLWTRLKAVTDNRGGNTAFKNCHDNVIALLCVNAPAKEYTVAQTNSAIESIRPRDPYNQIEAKVKEQLRKALHLIIEKLLDWVGDFLGKWLGL